jgi:hypothetical protein
LIAEFPCKITLLALVPRLAVQKSAYPRLRVVALVDPIISRSLVLVTRKTAATA